MPTTLLPQPRVLSVWRIILVFAAALPAFLAPLFLRPGSAVWYCVTGIWTALFLFFYLYYLPARLRGLSLRVEEDRLVLTSGVFNRVTRQTPMRGIQFISLQSSPLHRHWKLAGMVIVSPGARMIMPGLDISEAENLMRVCLQ